MRACGKLASTVGAFETGFLLAACVMSTLAAATPTSQTADPAANTPASVAATEGLMAWATPTYLRNGSLPPHTTVYNITTRCANAPDFQISAQLRSTRRH